MYIEMQDEPVGLVPSTVPSRIRKKKRHKAGQDDNGNDETPRRRETSGFRGGVKYPRLWYLPAMSTITETGCTHLPHRICVKG